MKAAGERIAMLTAYDHASAIMAGRAGVPVLLVGDSLGMVVHGHETTLPVTLDDMVRHAASVVRAGTNALIVGDLPFLTYATPADAVHAARRLMQEGGVQAVKLEGGGTIARTVRHLCELGVPVMGHLGFTPQAQHQLGIRVQAKQAADARRLLEDALLLEAAGAFAIVLELVPAPLAAEVTREQVFLQLHQELPYEAAVETEKWEDRPDGSVRIEQTIHVQRDGQRAIFLGKGGARIKQIGARSRHELGRMLERPVHLFLHVKVSERWADDPAHYRAIGLDYEPK